MSRVTSESIERVRQAADMVEIVSAHTELRRRGARWLGLCPFHDERTPSFSVDPVDKVYYCFGCGAGGDIFSFLEEKEGLDFRDAVEQLADRYGVELEFEPGGRDDERRRSRERLLELLAKTAGVLCALPVGLGRGGAAPAPTSRDAASAARCSRSSAWVTRPAPGTGCW